MPQYEQADYSYYRLQKNDMIRIRLLTTNDEAAAIFDINSSNSTSSSSGSVVALLILLQKFNSGSNSRTSARGC